MKADLPIVIIPGIQGHAEWMTPAIAALRQIAVAAQPATTENVAFCVSVLPDTLSVTLISSR